MTLAIWNALWTPLTISFDRAKHIGESVGLQVTDIIIDAVFWIDIFLQFITSYVEKATGDEIFSPKKIAYHYMLKGSFLIDFMSTFPFRPIGDSAGLNASHMYFVFADIMSLLKV